MQIKRVAERPPGWAILKNIPKLFGQKTISVQDFNEKMSQPLRFSLNKKESFALIKEMKHHGLAEYQPNKGRILFR